MAEKCDVIIVGAGTAGVYLGWLLAKQGHLITIIDRDSRNQVGQRLEVIHFETDEIEKAGVPPPVEGTEEFICRVEKFNVLTPDKKNKLSARALQTVLKLPLFLQRMYNILEAEGVKFEFKCKFSDLIYENGKVVGIFGEKKEKKMEFQARLVVDASGTDAVIRTSLPSDYGIETFKLGPYDVMHVPIRYIVWSNPSEPHPEPILADLNHISFLNPSYMENGAILGIGQPGSYKQANQVLDDYVASSNWPSFKVKKTEKGITPYRRPPYSLVSDGVFCIGDAAAITRPYSGHGVTATWYLCRIAAKVINKALKKEKTYLSKEMLWEINVEYFKNQGAQFAGTIVLLSSLINLTEKELNYFLQKIEFLIDEDSNLLGDLNLNLTTWQYLKIAGQMIWGLLIRKLSLKHIKQFLKMNSLSNIIRKHYENFPEKPLNFESWVEKADELWSKKKIIRKKFPSTEVEYH